MILKKALRKWNNIIHRDLGYFFVGMSIIYGLSGIALNHLHDWNPSYSVSTRNLTFPVGNEKPDKNKVINWLKENNCDRAYKKHYFPSDNSMKIFLKSGSVDVDLKSGEAFEELLSRRPIFFEVNLLHYNPGKLWMYFSDFFAGGLIVLAVSGMFVLRGKNGLGKRGIWFVIAGIVIPVLLLINYL